MQTGNYLVAYRLFKFKLNVTQAYYFLGEGWVGFVGESIEYWMPLPDPPEVADD